MVKVHNKLVRDNIIEIIEKDGRKAHYEILDDERYIQELEKKLGEEYQEYLADHSLEEMCDVLEVLEALCKAKGFTKEMIKDKQEAKRNKNGAFEKKIYLKEVED